jgi:cobalt-zinc-cadmium efflux system membrane fusion protein
MYVSGHIHTDKNYTRVLPNDAIVTEGTNSYIFVADNSIEMDEHDEHADHDKHGEVDEHGYEDLHRQAFRMVEIITGQNDETYTEVKLLDSIPDDSKIVMNVAYYLLAELKKGEAEHHH